MGSSDESTKIEKRPSAEEKEKKTEPEKKDEKKSNTGVSNTLHPSTFEKDTNLYVRNLPLEVTDDLLYATFAPYGTVVEHKIMRDITSNVSLGFGFVRFQKASESQLAISTLHGHTLGKVPLIVKLADSKSENKPSDNLYIKQMPTTWDEAALQALFQGYGSIVQSVVLRDSATGQSRGLGFVRFSTVTEATQAMQSLHGYQPPDGTETLVVRYAETEQEKTIRNISKIGKGPGGPGGAPGAPPAVAGYTAALQYQQQQMAAYQQQMAAYGYSAQTFGGAGGSQQPSNRYSPYGQAFGGAGGAAGGEPDQTNLFIFHLPVEVDETALYQLFSPFGPLESVKVCTDGSGMSKGYGFVKYYNAAEALHAIQTMNGYKIGSKFLKVQIKNSQKGGGRR